MHGDDSARGRYRRDVGYRPRPEPDRLVTPPCEDEEFESAELVGPKLMTAEFFSSCVACLSMIEPGDELRLSQHGWVHSEC